jgi:hypothetical protein
LTAEIAKQPWVDRLTRLQHSGRVERCAVLSFSYGTVAD